MSDHLTIDGYDISDFEFIDFGSSEGGSLSVYKDKFQVKGKGLGIDNSPKKVESAKKAGHDVACLDITDLDIEAQFRFCTMHHVLEHIPSLNDVKAILRKAVQISKEFVFIKQPYFDADAYLFQKGFKLFWSDWTGHPNNMTSLELYNCMIPLFNEDLIKGFSIYFESPIFASSYPSIHNIDSATDQTYWEKGNHSEKKIIEFDFPVFKETVAIMDIDGKSTKKVEKCFPDMEKVFSSRKTEEKKWFQKFF